MTIKHRYLRKLYRLFKAIILELRIFAYSLKGYLYVRRAVKFSRTYTENIYKTESSIPLSINPLWDYFQNHKEGNGIWKWEHYFEIYHRHFAKFIGRKVNVLEIGIYSGGSLEMWRSYFGEKSHIYGVDIQDPCKEYNSDHVSIFIGDQADRSFWRNFRKSVEGIDILIDDGGHTPEQQRITLEEMLPFIRPGGVYLCEDVHEYPHMFNEFATFAATLVYELNALSLIPCRDLTSNVSRFQSSVHSIHFYPYAVVIEKHCTPQTKLSCPRHGTVWQPFLGKVA